MRSRVLVTGWWSFLHGEATAGDLAAGDAVATWLTEAGIDHVVAWSPVLAGAARGPTIEECEPSSFSDLVFVCGPLGGWQVEELCDRYATCRRTAIGVSVVDPATAARFDEVIARDGPGGRCADLSFAAPVLRRWPLVVLIRANAQPEYGDRSRHLEVHAAVEEGLRRLDVTTIEADTRVDPREWRQRSGAQLDSLLAAADVVVTTRLHGLVLALRAGTPAVAVDPVAGGAKVTAQAQGLAWPALLEATEVDPEKVAESIAWCRSPASLDAVRHSLGIAEQQLTGARNRLVETLGSTSGNGHRC